MAYKTCRKLKINSHEFESGKNSLAKTSKAQVAKDKIDKLYVKLKDFRDSENIRKWKVNAH